MPPRSCPCAILQPCRSSSFFPIYNIFKEMNLGLLAILTVWQPDAIAPANGALSADPAADLRSRRGTGASPDNCRPEVAPIWGCGRERVVGAGGAGGGAGFSQSN